MAATVHTLDRINPECEGVVLTTTFEPKGRFVEIVDYTVDGVDVGCAIVSREEGRRRWAAMLASGQWSHRVPAPAAPTDAELFELVDVLTGELVAPALDIEDTIAVRTVRKAIEAGLTTAKSRHATKGILEGLVERYAA